MDRIDRILENRIFKNSSPPFKVLEKRLTEALELERKILIFKFSKRLHEQAKRQFIVFLISCFESYLEEMFKLMIDKNQISIEKLLELRKLKYLKFNLEELKTIDENKIKLSEIISNEINFQNFVEIMALCSIIDFNKYFDLLKKHFENGNVGFTKKESTDAIISLAKYRKSTEDPWKNSKFSKDFFRMVVRNLYRAPIHEKKKMLGTIELGIQIRHKIVHKAANFKLPHKVFHLALFLSIMHFCAIIQEIYNIKLGIVSPP